MRDKFQTMRVTGTVNKCWNSERPNRSERKIQGDLKNKVSGRINATAGERNLKTISKRDKVKGGDGAGKNS